MARTLWWPILALAVVWAQSCRADGGNTSTIVCPSKAGNVFLLIEWNLRSNATTTTASIAELFRDLNAPLLIQTPGFVEIMLTAINETTIRLVTIFTNSQQLAAARTTINMFVLNNVFSQIALVRSVEGVVRTYVVNQALCSNHIEHINTSLALRFVSIQTESLVPPLTLLGRERVLAQELAPLPGFREFFVISIVGQAIIASVFDTRLQALDAAQRMMQFTDGPPLAGQLALIEADVSMINFDRFTISDDSQGKLPRMQA